MNLVVKFWQHITKDISAFRIAIAVFLLFIVVLDENSFFQSAKYSREISKLEDEVHHYKVMITECEEKLEELQSSSENLESFAREQYFMKRPNETLFLIGEF